MTGEVPALRKALVSVILAIALFAVVVIQLTVVNRLPLPGAAAPDLVLLLITAIAVFTGPAVGAVTGFAGGLTLDVAPPAGHYVGEYALVFCLAGYAAARIVQAVWDSMGDRDVVTIFSAMAAATAAGEAGKAGVGILLSAPDVTAAAVSRVFPAAILYDLLLAPLVFWLVTRVTRGAVGWNTVPEVAPAPDLGPARPSAPVFRVASAGAAPAIGFVGTGGDYHRPPPARRLPTLRLSGTRSPASHRTKPAARGSAPLSLAGAGTPKLNFAGGRQVAPAGKAGRSGQPGKYWLREAVSSAGRSGRRPSRGWRATGGGTLTAGALARATAGAKGRAGQGTGASPRTFAGGRGGSAAGAALSARPARSPAEALAARSAPSGLSALAGAGTPLTGGRSPRVGWLRAASGGSPLRRRVAPRSGWLGSTGQPRAINGSGPSIRKGALRRNSRGNWYAASSSAWLRRGRQPWRRYLPGGRSPGARTLARGATASGIRKPRLFGLLGGRR